MTTKAHTTESEEFVVYHRDNAGSPDVHEGGPWFFEPVEWGAGEVYSGGYTTAVQALRAAEAWESSGGESILPDAEATR